MIVKFNPYVNQNINCRAVNQKYLKTAEESYRRFGKVNFDWYNSILDDAVIWRDIPKQDAIDTMQAVKKYVSQEGMKAYNYVLNRIKQV